MSEEHYVSVDGVRTHYLERGLEHRGKRPTVLLLHSAEFGGSAETSWFNNIDALATRYHVLAPDHLGFGRTDRDLNVHRIGVLGTLLQKHNVVPLFAVVSPYEASRARAIASLQGCLLVHTTCSMESLLARDPKGLYAKALRGEIPHFTGVSDPYEAPENPELRVDSSSEDIAVSEERVWQELKNRGLIPLS